MGVLEDIKTKIQNQVRVDFIEVINESHKHNVPAGSESHFNVIIASDDFIGLNRVQRQRKVYEILTEEFKQGLHALSLKLYTCQEWTELKDKVDLTTPKCRG